METKINGYTKKNGELMLFINGENGASVGITKKFGYQSTKTTQGGKKVWSAFCENVRNATPIASGADLSKVENGDHVFELIKGFAIVITEVATVGGVKVGEDGLYIVLDGDIYKTQNGYVA